MTTTMKCTISALSGLIVGGGVATLVTKNIFEKKAQAEIMEARNTFRTLSQEKYKGLKLRLDGLEYAIDTVLDKETCEKVLETANNVINEEDLEEDEDGHIKRVLKPPRKAKDDEYEKIVLGVGYASPEGWAKEIRPEPIPEILLPRDPDDPFEYTIRVPSNNAPYLITEEEFYNGDQNFDKRTIYYYEGDDTLCDEGEEVMDIDTFVGGESLEVIDRVVYVRNERYGVDYEIIKMEGAYAEVCLGYNLDDAYPDGIPKRRKREEDDE